MPGTNTSNVGNCKGYRLIWIVTEKRVTSLMVAGPTLRLLSLHSIKTRWGLALGPHVGHDVDCSNVQPNQL